MTQTDTGGLLPCPFCGNQPFKRFEKNINGEKYPDHWFIWCENLDCTATPEAMEESLEQAITAWNTRAPPPDSGGVREALEPFAKISLIRDSDPGALNDMIDAPDLAITPKDVRRARAALSPPPTAGREECDLHESMFGWDCVKCNRRWSSIPVSCGAPMALRGDGANNATQPTVSPNLTLTPSPSAEPVAWLEREARLKLADAIESKISKPCGEFIMASLEGKIVIDALRTNSPSNIEDASTCRQTPSTTAKQSR